MTSKYNKREGKNVPSISSTAPSNKTTWSQTAAITIYKPVTFLMGYDFSRLFMFFLMVFTYPSLCESSESLATQLAFAQVVRRGILEFCSARNIDLQVVQLRELHVVASVRPGSCPLNSAGAYNHNLNWPRLPWDKMWIRWWVKLGNINWVAFPKFGIDISTWSKLVNHIWKVSPFHKAMVGFFLRCFYFLCLFLKFLFAKFL